MEGLVPELVPQAIEVQSTFRCRGIWRNVHWGSLHSELLVQRLDLVKFFHAVPSSSAPQFTFAARDSRLALSTVSDAATKNPVGLSRRATTKQMGLIREGRTFLSFTTGTLLRSWLALMFSLRAPVTLLLAEIIYYI